MMIILVAVYTYECFTVFAYEDGEKKRSIFRNQNILMFMIHFMAFMGMYFKKEDMKILIFYLVQVLLLIAILVLYTNIYPKVSRLVVNNMCMLLTVGLIMITRLSYNKAVKQFIIICFSVGISLIVPVIVRKVKGLSELYILYGVIGVVALLAVFILGVTSDGAKLGFSIGGIGIQPSEFVKILFVFFTASRFHKSIAFKNIVSTTIVAAMHVLILVISVDLGAALIIFVVYLVMLYVATRQPFYSLAGLAAGALASVAAFFLFSHVRVRVLVWQDPFAMYQTGGYQVAQSLFAIGTGSWFGTGLFQGKADTIPVADEDFIFSAIAEEMGLIFALCVVLICLSCYIMFLNIAMQLKQEFYKYVALGLGTCYIFQTFLTIGGVCKFIPSTGVTLPLISYGGSSVFSTLIMFAIIQGLYILKEDEVDEIEEKKRRIEQRNRHYHSRSGREKEENKNTTDSPAKRRAQQRKQKEKEAFQPRIR